MKLSIITVNLNNAEGLGKTIESVVNQSFTDFEYIIIDGGSTDDSVDIIKKYGNKVTYWVSEPDKGIYNAMNKGIKAAKGEYCQFLNSGDWLIDNNVVKDVFFMENNEDVLYGNVFTEKGTIEYPDKLSLNLFFQTTLCHQAVFHKTELFEHLGLYKEELSIVADWEFLLNILIKNNFTYKHINKTVCFYDYNGMSSNPESAQEYVLQREKILKNMFPRIYDDYLEFNRIRKNLVPYENSFLIRQVSKLHQNRIYKYIKGLD